MSVPVVIALGGNLGDVRSIGEAALAQLHETPGIEVQRASRWYSTEPVGCAGRFLNAAALLHCDLTPTQLLLRLQEIETGQGRVRTGHWTPRPLDLDIVLFGQWQVEHPQLQLPHPAAWSRRFVLDPACEIAGEMVHVGHQITLNQLRDRLLRRPLLVGWSGEITPASVTEGAVQARFGSLIRWVDATEAAVIRFVPRIAHPEECIRDMAVSSSLSPASDISPAGGRVAGERVGVRGPHRTLSPPHPGPLPHSGVLSESRADCGGEGAETTEYRPLANAHHPESFEIAVPNHLDTAREIVCQTLISLLDEPVVQP